MRVDLRDDSRAGLTVETRDGSMQRGEDQRVNMSRLVSLLCVLLATVAIAQNKAPRKGKLAEEPAAAPVAPPTPEPPPAPAPTPEAPAARPAMVVSQTEKPRLAVLRVEAQGVAAEQAAAMSDAIVSALAARGLFTIVSYRDIETALGAERQRQLLGVCETQPDACGISVGDVMSAPFVLSGQLSRIGTAFQLTLQTVDTLHARAIGRANRIASSIDELQRLVPFIAAEATGVPLPPPPSRVFPITLLVVGGSTVLAGAVAGIVTFTQQGQLNDELCPGGVPENGRCTGEGLRERGFYLAQDDALIRQKWLAAGLLAGGAVITVLGLVLMPPAENTGRVSAMVVPTLGGVSVVGGFW